MCPAACPYLVLFCMLREPVHTGSNRFKLDHTGQTGSNRENPGKKCTVSSCSRLYKPSRYRNCHHNRSSISTEHFDSILQSTSRCRDISDTLSFVSIYYIYLCLYCNRSPIFAHLFRASLETMKYTCSKCNKVFARNYHLLRHERTACNSTTTTVSPPSVCSKCGKVFGKKHHLQRHETTVCVDTVSPPLPKSAKREDTTPATLSLANIPSVHLIDFHSPMLCQQIC